MDKSHKSVRVQCGMLSVPTYGVSKVAGQPYELTNATLPAEHVWSIGKYLHHAPALFDSEALDISPQIVKLLS